MSVIRHHSSLRLLRQIKEPRGQPGRQLGSAIRYPRTQRKRESYPRATNERAHRQDFRNKLETLGVARRNQVARRTPLRKPTSTASPSPSDLAFRSGQLCRIEFQVLTGLAHHAHVEGLTRTAERNFRLSAFPMHGYNNLPLVPLPMFAVIDVTPLLYKPFSERGAFHCSVSRALRPVSRRVFQPTISLV